MNRITEIEIAGKKYPLNFSLKASKEVVKRYGAIEKMADAFTGKPIDELLDEIIWLLSLLLNQGAEYMRIMENQEIKQFTKDDLEVVLGFMDLHVLKKQLFDAMIAGRHQEVEVETQKNAETTQSD